MGNLVIETLGGLKILRDGKPVMGLESRKVEALLVYLAVQGRSMKREVLTGFLWGNKGQREAQASLREGLSNLRKQFREFVEITHDSAGICPGALIWVDVKQLEQCWSDARRTGPLTGNRAVSLANHILSLYKGDFLQGFSIRDCLEFDRWLTDERERILSLVKDALHAFVDIEIRSALFEEALEHVDRLLALDPLIEEDHRRKMMLLAISGQRSAAIAQYQLCCLRLGEELGVEPDRETVRLAEKIRKGEPVWTEETVKVEAYLRARTNLPAQTSAFFGRKRDLGVLTGLLRRPDVRLVTLTGPGGIGKTRLGLEAARLLSMEFAHGVWFVELASLTKADQIMPAVATALEIEECGRTPLHKQVTDHLMGQQLLLILDNFEHLLAGASELSGLLRSAPGLKILVTSRQCLRLYGEYEYNVEPLQLPPARDVISVEELMRVESAELFVERGWAARADFQVTEANAPVIAAILHKLEGLPLAIELSAAWLKVLDPDLLLDRLNNRLNVLRDGPIDLTPRQQTMQSTIEWSYILLGSSEKVLFRRLAVFIGGWSLEAAAGVCGQDGLDVPPSHIALVEKNLVRPMAAKDGLRYGMLETIREYAQAKLYESGEIEDLRERHAIYYRKALDHPPDGVFSHLPNLDAELDNFEAGFYWMQNHNRPEALLLGFHVSFHKYYARSFINQSVLMLDSALETAGSAPLLDQAYAYNLRALLCFITGECQRWEEYVKKSLHLARQVDNHPNLLQCGLLEAGRLYIHTGDLAAAEAAAQEGISISQGYYTADFLAILGDVALLKGDLRMCRQYYEEGMRASEQLPGWNWGWLLSRWYCAYLDALSGNLVGARLHIKKIREIPDLKEIHFNMIKEIQGQIYLEEGLPDLAQPLLEELFQHHERAGMVGKMASTLLKLSQLALLQKDGRRAARMLGAAEHILANTCVQHHALDALLLQRLREEAQSCMPPDIFIAAIEEGRAMSPREALHRD